MAHYEHTWDPANGHERDERIQLRKPPKLNANGLTP
jgi:hypothetical protein